MISDPQELYRFLATPGFEVANMLFASDVVVCASWRFVAGRIDPELTSYERSHRCVCDSWRSPALVFVSRQTTRMGYILRHIASCTSTLEKVVALVETGDNLGAMTSELRPSEFIEEFVSGGPKHYAYKTVHAATGERKTVCKIRGITLNYSTS